MILEGLLKDGVVMDMRGKGLLPTFERLNGIDITVEIRVDYILKRD